MTFGEHLKESLEIVERTKDICDRILVLFRPWYKTGGYSVTAISIDVRDGFEDRVVVDIETWRSGGDSTVEDIPLSWIELYNSGRDEELKVKMNEANQRIEVAKKAKEEKLAKETAELNEQKERETLSKLIEKYGLPNK
jgi:hypothetical protein